MKSQSILAWILLVSTCPLHEVRAESLQDEIENYRFIENEAGTDRKAVRAAIEKLRVSLKSDPNANKRQRADALKILMLEHSTYGPMEEAIKYNQELVACLEPSQERTSELINLANLISLQFYEKNSQWKLEDVTDNYQVALEAIEQIPSTEIMDEIRFRLPDFFYEFARYELKKENYVSARSLYEKMFALSGHFEGLGNRGTRTAACLYLRSAFLMKGSNRDVVSKALRQISEIRDRSYNVFEIVECALESNAESDGAGIVLSCLNELKLVDRLEMTELQLSRADAFYQKGEHKKSVDILKSVLAGNSLKNLRNLTTEELAIRNRIIKRIATIAVETGDRELATLLGSQPEPSPTSP